MHWETGIILNYHWCQELVEKAGYYIWRSRQDSQSQINLVLFSDQSHVDSYPDTMSDGEGGGGGETRAASGGSATRARPLVMPSMFSGDKLVLS